MKFAKVLEKLSNACGVAGIEQEVRSLIHKFLKPFADEVKKDKLTGEDLPA
jgi:putative aminopeptidase FrvX